MAETYNRSLTGRNFAKQQTAFGTAADYVATDAFKCLKDSPLAFTAVQDDVARDDNVPTRDVEASVQGKVGPHTWTFGAYALPSGTPGTAPDIDPIMESMLTKSTTTQFTLTGTPTTSILYTTDVGAVTADAIIALHTATTDVYQCVHVATVTSASGTDTITLSHAVSHLPVAGDIVYATVQYAPRNLVDTTKLFTLARVGEIDMEQVSSAIADTFKLECAGQSDQAKVTMTGYGARYVSLGKQVLTASGITDSDSTVDTSMYITGVDSSNPVYATIEAEGVNTAETVKFTAYDTATLSGAITRAQKGTSASAHATNAVMVPYQPSETTAGVPIPGVYGAFYLSGTAFSVNSQSFETKEGVTAIEVYGDTEPSGYEYTGLREPKVTANVFAKTDSALLKQAMENHAGTTYDVLMQFGNRLGKMWAVWLPSVLFKNPSVTPPKNGLIHFTLESKLVLGDGADGSYRMAVL